MMPAADVFHCTLDARGHGPLSPADVALPLWSVGKTVIAALGLMLAAEGRIALDTRPGPRGASLRQLLRHEAGLPDYAADPDYHRAVGRGDPPWPGRRLLRAGLRIAPRRPPGSGWAYSNIGYMLARARIEAAAGMDLAALLALRISGPLGLPSLALAAGPAAFAALPWPGARGYDPRWVGHGCLVATPRDAARLMRALLAPGPGADPFPGLGDRSGFGPVRRLGGAIAARPWIGHGYGTGIMGGEMGGIGRALGHTGGGPGASAAVYHFPDAPGGPRTVACFAAGADPGRIEAVAARLAAGLAAGP